MACVKKIGDRYRADWRDRQGNRYRRFFDKQKDALDHIATVKVDLKAGSYLGPKQIPTFRKVAEQWFARKQSKGIRVSTLAGYRKNLDAHILKAPFADARLNQITDKHITAFVVGLNATPRRKGSEKTLAPKTVNYLLRDLRAVFAYAVSVRLTAWNPTAPVENVKQNAREHDMTEAAPTRTDRVVTEDEVLDADQCRALIAAADDGFDRTLLMLAVTTGCRHNELLALQWSAIDLEAGSVEVRRSLSWAHLPGEPRRPRFFDPKTSKGKRTIPTAPAMILQLKKWRLACPKGALDLVFPTATGEPQEHTNVLRRTLRPSLKAAGLPLRFDLHSLRHSFCSSLLMAGTPPAEVQRYSGHSQLSVLLDVYAKFIKSQGTNAVANYAAAVLG